MVTKRIQIFDTTLRDGEQVPGCQLNTENKLIIAKALEEFGVDIMEVGFPISSPGDFKSVELISKEIKNSIVCALSRVIESDIKITADALKYAKQKRIHTGIGTSDIHIKGKFNSTREEIYERAVSGIKYAKKFFEDIEFYAEDAGRSDVDYLCKVLEGVINAGATVLNIPDTTGYCLPEEYGKIIKKIKENVKGIHKVTISTHCHNDLGLATANTISGLINGATQAECTINGIGERAGNTALEEVVMILKIHKHLGFETNIKTKKIIEISKLVSSKMNITVQPNKAIVGKNAFAHSSGIHQDGILKGRENYEIIDPFDVGLNKSEINLTARSGRAALNFKLKELGYDISKEELDIVYKDFLVLADENKGIGDKELHNLYKKIFK